jgi:hypothetical protein
VVGEERSYLGYAQIDNQGNWLMLIAAVLENTDISFDVSADGAYIDNIGNISLAPGETASQIDLNVEYSSVTLSGTIGDISVNGISYDSWFRIEAFKNDWDWLGQIEVSGGNRDWSITIPSANLASGDSIDFRVSIYENGSSLRWDIPEARQTYNGDGNGISGIQLNDVHMSFVVLMGTIGSVTIDGNPPDDIYIQARKQQGDAFLAETWYDGYSGSWYIITPANLVSGEIISLRVIARMDGSPWKESVTTTTYTGGDIINNITLGSISF